MSFRLKFDIHGLPHGYVIDKSEVIDNIGLIDKSKFDGILNIYLKELKNDDLNESYSLIIRGNEYWKGPYDILVPFNIDSIISPDGINRLNRDGKEEKITKEEYFNLYTKIEEIDGIDYRIYKVQENN